MVANDRNASLLLGIFFPPKHRAADTQLELPYVSALDNLRDMHSKNDL